MRKIALALALLIPLSGAVAHNAASGWEYDRECCHTFDCAQVRDPTIEVVPGGYRVTLPPGSHPMVGVGRSTVTAFVPFDSPRVRVSGDAFKHACVSAAGYIYCIYLPPGGV
jgi:hypothetical protein